MASTSYLKGRQHDQYNQVAVVFNYQLSQHFFME